MLAKSEDPNEQIILEQTLKNLQKQLERMDKEQASRYINKSEFDLKLQRIDDEIKDMDKKLQSKDLTEKEKFKLKQRKRAYYQERAIVRTEKQRFLRLQRKDKLTPEKERELALKKLFVYLTKQQSYLGGNPTIEEGAKRKSTFSVGNFLIFCRKYNIMFHPRENRNGITKEKLTTIFKRYAKNTKSLDFKGFQKAVKYLALEYFEARDDPREGMDAPSYWNPPD